MGVWRLCTVVRYRNLFRWGFMSYVLLLLLLLVLWTYHSRWDSEMVPEVSIPYVEHKHRNVDDILAAGKEDNSRWTPKPEEHVPHAPGFSGPKKYAANHSHPVLPVPALADMLVKTNKYPLSYVPEVSIPYVKHKHRNVDDILAAGKEDNSRVTPKPEEHVPHAPGFSGPKKYVANHSHPVLPLPALADTLVKTEALQQQCGVVRMVEFFGKKLTLQGDPVCQWLESPVFMADNRFVVYGSKMALLYDVIIDPSNLGGGPRGGENMAEVWGQEEEAEYLTLKPGFFTLECGSRPVPDFGFKDHLNQWTNAISCQDNATVASLIQRSATVGGLTIAVQRYEYVNLYHTMTDFYSAFLAMLIFNQHPDDVTVLFVDAHPQGGLDDTWRTLFGKVKLAGRLESPLHFSAMAWAVMGYNSPLNEHDRPTLPYLEEFRHLFLSRHDVDGSRKVNCERLNWLFIWRRDYVAHPRNKGGSVSRKIFNEDELLTAIKGVVPEGDRVDGLQLDALPMKEQLQIISNTDVLLGMHGAGLSHTLFLSPHAALLEFYPTYWPQANKHFRSFASWRRLHYQSWQNQDQENEHENHRTFIPPEIVIRMAKEARKNICG